jgi:hypothetical protein
MVQLGGETRETLEGPGLLRLCVKAITTALSFNRT